LLSCDISNFGVRGVGGEIGVSGSKSNVQILKDSESFCRTPDKNEYYDKLRNRSSQYPITYRPRKNFDVAYSYKYKFTCKQRKKMSRFYLI
jgi:hypothetical protein